MRFTTNSAIGRCRDHTTRRGFLQKATAAGSGLVIDGLTRAASAIRPAQHRPPEEVSGSAVMVHDVPGIAMHAPIILVTQSVSTEVNARAGTWLYLSEILRRAGLFFEQ